MDKGLENIYWSAYRDYIVPHLYTKWTPSGFPKGPMKDISDEDLFKLAVDAAYKVAEDPKNGVGNDIESILEDLMYYGLDVKLSDRLKKYIESEEPEYRGYPDDTVYYEEPIDAADNDDLFNNAYDKYKEMLVNHIKAGANDNKAARLKELGIYKDAATKQAGKEDSGEMLQALDNLQRDIETGDNVLKDIAMHAASASIPEFWANYKPGTSGGLKPLTDLSNRLFNKAKQENIMETLMKTENKRTPESLRDSAIDYAKEPNEVIETPKYSEEDENTITDMLNLYLSEKHPDMNVEQWKNNLDDQEEINFNRWFDENADKLKDDNGHVEGNDDKDPGMDAPIFTEDGLNPEVLKHYKDAGDGTLIPKEYYSDETLKNITGVLSERLL